MGLRSKSSGRARGQLAGENVRLRRREARRSDTRLGQDVKRQEAAESRALRGEARTNRNALQASLEQRKRFEQQDRTLDLQEKRIDTPRKTGLRSTASTQKAKFAAEDRTKATADREGMPTFLHDVVQGKSKREVLSKFNQFGDIRISDYALNPDNSVTITGQDGRQATISTGIVSGNLKKHFGIDIGRQSSSTTVKQPAFETGKQVEDFGRFYDITDLTSTQKAGVKDALANNVPHPEIAQGLGLEPTVDETEIDKLKESVFDAAKGLRDADKKGKKKEMDSARRELVRAQDELTEAESVLDELGSAGVRADDGQGLRGPAEAPARTGSGVGAISAGGRRVEASPEGGVTPVKTTKQEDVTREMVLAAQHAVDNPELYPDPREMAEAQAILSVIKQQAKEKAEVALGVPQKAESK